VAASGHQRNDAARLESSELDESDISISTKSSPELILDSDGTAAGAGCGVTCASFVMRGSSEAGGAAAAGCGGGVGTERASTCVN
jgi:hypothetical protein